MDVGPDTKLKGSVNGAILCLCAGIHLIIQDGWMDVSYMELNVAGLK